MSSTATAWLTLSLMLLMTSVFGTKGNRELVQKCGPLTQLLSCRASADIHFEPGSPGLSFVVARFHWSTLVYCEISQTRFATKIACFSLKLIYWRTVALPVHMNTWLKTTVSACVISFFSRAASGAASDSSFGTVNTFKDATRPFLKNKRKLCFSLHHCNCYSGLPKNDGTENVLGIVTEYMQFYIIKRSIIVN